MEPKNKGQTNFNECCDLTKKYIQGTYIPNQLENGIG